MSRILLLGLIGACTDDPAPDADGVTAEVSDDVATVVTVRWTTDSATAGWVEFGPTTDYGRSTPKTANTTEHEAVLLGLWASDTFHFRVVGEDGVVGADHEVATGDVPSGLPRMVVSGDPEAFDGYELLPLMGANPAFVVIDSQGRVVWYRLLDRDYSVVRGDVAVDGSGVVISQAATHDHELSPDAHVLRVSWDGSEVRTVSMPDLAHDLLQLPDGTLAGLCLAAAEGQTALGDRIVEIAPDGSVTEVWNAWQSFDPTTVGSEFLSDENWTHANAMSYDPVDDAYYVSLRHFSSTVKIDRPTGEVVWGLGGLVNDFTWPDGVAWPEEQHEAVAVDGGVLLFDNGTADRGWSRAVEVALDTEAMTAEPVLEIHHDPDLFVYAKGGVSRFDDGSTQVVWSTAGQVQDISPSGSIRWQLDVWMGTAVVFAGRVDDLYR